MAIYFFKNRNPSAGVYLTKVGVFASFRKVDNNVGILETTRDDVANDLRLAARGNRSGVQEIDSEEFEKLKKKAMTYRPSKPNWREEFKPHKKTTDTVTRAQKSSEPEERSSTVAANAGDAKKVPNTIEQSELPESLRPSASKEE